MTATDHTIPRDYGKALRYDAFGLSRAGRAGQHNQPNERGNG